MADIENEGRACLSNKIRGEVTKIPFFGTCGSDKRGRKSLDS